jgi:uncharacterized protein YcgL (UPF0745 family)
VTSTSLFYTLSNNHLTNSGFLMFCHIYRSSRKADTFLYLAVKDDFSILPESLLSIFGDPEFSFSLELTSDKKLAKEDVAEVLENLSTQGYHLQLRKDVLIEQMLTMKAAN